MKEYFLSVVCLSLVAGAIVTLCPSDSAKRYLRMLAGIALTLCIIAPISSFIGGGGLEGDSLMDLLEFEISEEQNYAEIYNNTILKAGKDQAERRLKSEILQALGGSEEDIDVNIYAHTQGEEIYIDSAQVQIYPSGLSLDPHFIKNYLSERLDCECEIIYKSDK